MKLVNFTFEKFRSVKDEISLPIHEISILIGQNGGGKTTTLDALDIFFNVNKRIETGDINNKLKLDNLEIIFSCKFLLDGQEKEFFKKYDKQLEDNFIIIYKKINFANNETYYFIKTLGTNTDLDNLELGTKRNPYENLCDKYHIENHKKLNISLMKEELRKIYEKLPKETEIEKIIDKKEIDTYLPKFIPLYSEGAPDPKNEMTKILVATLKDQVEELDIKNEVGRITDVVLKVCNQKIEEASNSIKKYCRDIERIDVNPEYNALQGLKLDEFNIVKKGGDKVKFDSEATGKKKQIMLGIYEWSNLQITEDVDKKFIIAFDEPDLHFDYIQISNLLNILKDFSSKDNVQVLTATHSIKFIDNFPPNQILHFSLNKRDETELIYITDEDYEQIGEFLKDLSFSIGFRSAFLFFEKKFVILEGESEYKAFPILFELINSATHFEVGISFINAENNITALNFAQFLKKNKKDVVIVVDKDSEKRKQFKKEGLRKLGFMPGKNLFFVGNESDSEGEFEGEFTSEQWVFMLNSKFPKANSQRWERADIDNIRNNAKISKELVKLVETECIMQISKPELAKEVAKSIKDKNEISDNLRTIILKLNLK